jgi:hypothetical protein
MLGTGHKKPARQLFAPDSETDDMTEWTTLDMNPRAKPDVVFDLDNLHIAPPVPVSSTGIPKNQLPFESERFHEIHAYEVLEHIGRQGDYKGFFREFREYWRVLKPGGWMIGTCPTLEDWGLDEPGHTRLITGKTLGFLTPGIYNLGNSPASDYREYVRPYWWRLLHNEVRTITVKGGKTFTRFYFGLKKDGTPDRDD